MSDILNQLRRGAEKVISRAEKLSKTAVKKTKDTMDRSKLKYAVSETEGKIKCVLAQMGKTIYDEYKNGAEFEGELADKCKLLNSLYEETEDLKAKLAELSDSVLCPVCGNMISNDACFCPKCGSKRNGKEETRDDNVVEATDFDDSGDNE